MSASAPHVANVRKAPTLARHLGATQKTTWTGAPRGLARLEKLPTPLAAGRPSSAVPYCISYQDPIWLYDVRLKYCIGARMMVAISR